jgi:predicted DNA-binding transcriptional regulator AlpA
MNKLRVLKVPFVHRKKEKKYYSSFLKWVMKHPDVVLPRKVSEIVTITGLSRDVIYGYMNHRRRKIFSFVTNEFPSFLQRVKFFPLKSGGKMPIKAIESLAFKVDRFTMNIYVTANLKQGTSRTFIATPGQFERYIGKEINL